MIAVTGANGLLGSFIVRKLIDMNEPFIALKRRSSDISLLQDINHKIRWRDADVEDSVALDEAFAGVSHVVHAAAVVSFNPRKLKKVMDTNVVGTRNVVNACLVNGVKRLVHVSSVAALGRQKHQHRIDEINLWVNNPMNTAYAESKYLAELEIFRGQEEGLSTVTISPSFILAPGDWHKSSAQLFKFVWNEHSFYTDGFLNYVDVRDVVEIAWQMLHSSLEGQRFIVSAGNISYREAFEKIAHHFNKKPPFINLNKTLLHLVARIEGIRSWFTAGEPILTRERARLCGTEFLYDNAKIRAAFNIDFQPIDSTLEWCCQYYMTKLMRKN